MRNVKCSEDDVSSPLPLLRHYIQANFLLLAAFMMLGLAGCTLVLPPETVATETQQQTTAGALPTDDSAACAAARSLATQYPQEALELIDKIRGSYAPQESQGRTNCTNERNFALQKLGEAQQASKGTPFPTLTTAPTPTASPTPTSSPTPPPFEPAQAQQAWDKYVATWISPWQNLALTAAGGILAMLILARLIAFLPSPYMPPRVLDWKHHSKSLRRTAFWTGLILIFLATLTFVTQLASSQLPGGPSVSVWGVRLLLILAVVGSLLFGIWIASRPRLSIVVRDKEGKPNESLMSYIIALLTELGAARPHGIEVPRGADATGLADASVSAELSNKVLAALAKLVHGIVGTTPWRIVIDSATDDDLSVVITRNGWSVRATTISRSNALFFPGNTQPGSPRPQAVTSSDVKSPDVPPKPPELYKLAAAFIVATIAEHEQGFEGLCGATDWRSIGLQYLATTEYALDEKNQRILLGRAVELDPDNLLASTALMNNIYRKSKEHTPLQEYESWLDHTIEQIEEVEPKAKDPESTDETSNAADKPATTNEPSNPADKPATTNEISNIKIDEATNVSAVRVPSKDIFEGHRALLYRLELTRLFVGMNRMAAVKAPADETPATAATNETSATAPTNEIAGGDPPREAEEYLELAIRLINRLSSPASQAPDLEKRLRLHVALIHHDMDAAVKRKHKEAKVQATINLSAEDEGKVQKWYKDALDSLSPAIAYSAACSYARTYDSIREALEGNLPQEELDKKVQEQRDLTWMKIENRLKIAVVDAGLAEWVTEDPELHQLLGKDQKWEKFKTSHVENRLKMTAKTGPAAQTSDLYAGG